MSNIDWKSASQFEGPRASPGFRLWHQSMKWQKQLNAVLKPYGLTQPRFSILAAIGWLTRDCHSVTQQDVADFTSMDRMHISQIVRALDRNGFLERVSSSRDGRAVELSLSEFGARKLGTCLPIVEKQDAHFFQ